MSVLGSGNVGGLGFCGKGVEVGGLLFGNVFGVVFVVFVGGLCFFFWNLGFFGGEKEEGKKVWW